MKPADKSLPTPLPLISVIIPAYNAEKTLHQAVNSALNQTYNTLEVLIIDDGSRDATAKIARQYEASDDRVRFLINEKNMGVAETRNKGVRAARGSWIAFLDSDDAWTEDKLEKQMRCAETVGGRFVFTASAFMDAEGNRKLGMLHAPERVTYGELLKQNVISCSSVLIQRELVLNVPMAGEGLHEDFAVWLRILQMGETAYGVDEPLLIYRMYAASKSGNKWKAAQMTYRVYRYIGLDVLRAGYYWSIYLWRSVRKYRKLL